MKLAESRATPHLGRSHRRVLLWHSHTRKFPHLHPPDRVSNESLISARVVSEYVETYVKGNPFLSVWVCTSFTAVTHHRDLFAHEHSPSPGVVSDHHRLRKITLKFIAQDSRELR